MPVLFGCKRYVSSSAKMAHIALNENTTSMDLGGKVIFLRFGWSVIPHVFWLESHVLRFGWSVIPHVFWLESHVLRFG